jgi:hypothetical protein
VAAKRTLVWIPRELYASFCGEENDGRCLRHYDKARSRGNPMVSGFSWLALLCFPVWLAYRQRWQLLAVFVTVIGLVSLITGALEVEVPGAAYTGMGIALGFMARGFLLADANARYAKLLRQNQSQEAIASALARKAAPRPLFAVLALVALTSIIIIELSLGGASS